MHRLAELMEEHADELAMADTRDMGKPITQSRHDVARSVLNVRFFADHARMSTAETLPMDTGHHAYTRWEPVGVVAAISPWNFRRSVVHRSLTGAPLTLMHNGLAAQLSSPDLRLLERRCQPVELSAGDVLAAPDKPHGHIHFLTSASVALVVRHIDGSGLAVGLAGREGAVGLQFALGLGAGQVAGLTQSRAQVEQCLRNAAGGLPGLLVADVAPLAQAARRRQATRRPGLPSRRGTSG